MAQLLGFGLALRDLVCHVTARKRKGASCVENESQIKVVWKQRSQARNFMAHSPSLCTLSFCREANELLCKSQHPVLTKVGTMESLQRAKFQATSLHHSCSPTRKKWVEKRKESTNKHAGDGRLPSIQNYQGQQIERITELDF